MLRGSSADPPTYKQVIGQHSPFSHLVTEERGRETRAICGWAAKPLQGLHTMPFHGRPDPTLHYKCWYLYRQEVASRNG
jgi:hypothetical protein